MPIREYECKGCEYAFEKIEGMTEEPVRVCPKCQGELRRIISKSTFHLKGGGWGDSGYSSSLGDLPGWDDDNFSQNDIKGLKE